MGSFNWYPVWLWDHSIDIQYGYGIIWLISSMVMGSFDIYIQYGYGIIRLISSIVMGSFDIYGVWLWDHSIDIQYDYGFVYTERLKGHLLGLSEDFSVVWYITSLVQFNINSNNNNGVFESSNKAYWCIKQYIQVIEYIIDDQYNLRNMKTPIKMTYL